MSYLKLQRNLPFYPSYKTEVQGYITIWIFMKDFSQSRYNYKNIPTGSNACTIITVLLAARCHYNKIRIVSTYTCELYPTVICAFAECILEGNEIHERLRKNGSLENMNLTVPEAIDSTGHKLRYITEWKSVLYMELLKATLYMHLKEHVLEWYQTSMYQMHPDLYVILIADHRSVLFVFQNESDLVSLIDSHQHLNDGAIIAQVPRLHLKALCQWFHEMIKECYNSHPNCYELSFLYFRSSRLSNRFY